MIPAIVRYVVWGGWSAMAILPRFMWVYPGYMGVGGSIRITLGTFMNCIADSAPYESPRSTGEMVLLGRYPRVDRL